MSMINQDFLVSSLTQALFFLEELNWRFCQSLRSEAIVDFRALVLSVRKAALFKRRFYRSDFSDLMQRSGVPLRLEEHVVEAVCASLLYPALIEPVFGTSDVRVSGSAPSRRLPRSSTRWERISEDNRDILFASKSADEEGARSVKVKVASLAGAVDPIAEIQNFLGRHFGISEQRIFDVVQRWLQDQFGLTYSKIFIYKLATTCDKLNELFFGARSVSVAVSSVEYPRPARVSARLVVEKIRECLASEGADEQLSRQSVGIFLLLRFAGVIRCDFDFLEKGGHFKEFRGGNAAAVPLGPILYRTRPFCPLRLSRLLSHLYGSAFGILGLREIFQGGLLIPYGRGSTIILRGREGSGKTVFALSMMVDVARQGGLSVYFSLEESYDAIVERIVSFRLLEPDEYHIYAWSGDPNELEHLSRHCAGGKGVLLLYINKGKERFSMIDAIRAIGYCEPSIRRAFTIDSVNALEFTRLRSGLDNLRSMLFELQDVVDQGCLIGVLISEIGEGAFESLAYLGDTVIDVHTDGRKELQVIKCRGQDFHIGRHPYRLLDRQGVRIWSNLTSVRAELREKVRLALSEEWSIVASGEANFRIPERSFIIVVGDDRQQRESFALNLLLSESQRYQEAKRSPHGVLVVSFQVGSAIVLQRIDHSVLRSTWLRVPNKNILWVPTGSGTEAEETVDRIARVIYLSRRSGFPLERVVFLNAEIGVVGPSDRAFEAFWITVIELLRTEGITSIFSVADIYAKPGWILRAEADFVLDARIGVSGESGVTRDSSVEGRWLLMHGEEDGRIEE